jgi:CRP/FNR family transcriptional regulator
MRDPTSSDKLLIYFSGNTRVHYEKHEIIIRPDELPDGVFILERGFVKAYNISKYGDRSVLMIYKAGEAFSLSWVLKGYATGAFFEAITDVTLYRVSREQLRRAMAERGEVADTIISQLVVMLDVYRHRIQNFELRSAYERLAFRLAYLAGRFGLRRDGHILIDVPLTHQDIAESINLSRETVTRLLQRMEKEGLIEQQRHMLVITNMTGLEATIGETI